MFSIIEVDERASDVLDGLVTDRLDLQAWENIPAPEMSEIERQGIIGQWHDGRRLNATVQRLGREEQREMMLERIHRLLLMAKSPIHLDQIVQLARKLGLYSRVRADVIETDQRIVQRLRRGVKMVNGQAQTLAFNPGYYRKMWGQGFSEIAQESE